MVSVALLASCTNDGDQQAGEPTSPPASPSGASAATAPTATLQRQDPPSTRPTRQNPPPSLTRQDAPLVVTIEELRGDVPRSRWAPIRRAITRPISAWLRGGYVAGPYPRVDFTKAFASWTGQAAAKGRRHRAFTTNAALGRDLVAVAADKQRVRLFVFGTGGRTGGATARVLLRLTGAAPDGSLRRLTVQGELYLTRKGDRWRIFGYELRRLEAPR